MRFPISKYKVYGNSMSPNLLEGQEVLSINWFINPKVGDIVVIKKSGKEMVKRIEKVEKGWVFVVGDNEAESTDSRHFGKVKIDDVVGRVVYSSNEAACSNCESAMIGIAGRKDAICKNCGFKLTCCGEP